ncbi:MAG: insulinase family protein [Vicinamibacterales bacterium]|jgi:zinc protease|nr:insulinase family protein [Vicinamibacterales bacterium]
MTRPGRRALACTAAVMLAWASPAPGQVRDWPSETMPKPLASRPLTLPPHEIRTLPNGLRVVAIEHHEQPLVSLRLLVGAGTAQDLAPKLGVANMVATLLDQGTTTRTAQQIADAVDTIGGNIRAGAGTDATFAYTTVLKNSLPLGLDLLSDIVRSPAFAQEALDRQRDQLRSALRVSYQDPNYLASLVFRRLVYGLHPYGYPATGTPASLERITRGDLVEYHQRHFAPDNCILAVAGDVTAAEAFAAADKAFGRWERRDAVAPFTLGPPAPARRVVIVDLPGAVHTEIRAGHLGILRTSDDFTAVELAVRILGGDGANRLQQILRTRRGIAYGASAGVQAYRRLSDIVAETETPPEAAGEALRVMVGQFLRLQDQRVDVRELDDAKAVLAGRFPLGIETPDDIATSVLTALFYEWPLSHLETFRERVNAVTPDAIQRAARAHLRPNRLSMVLVGPAPFIVSQLERAGFRNGEVVSASELDVTTPDLVRPARLASTTAPLTSVAKGVSREDWEKVRSVLDPAVAAAGGLDALRGVKTIRATAKTVMQTPGGPMRATTRTYVQYPGRMRVDATLPSGEVVQAYSDGQAWLKDTAGIRDAPTPMRDEFAQGLRRDWIALFLAVADNRVLGRVLPDEKGLAGRPLRVVELWSDGLSPTRVAVDAETRLIAWVSYQTGGPGGRVTVKESFDDYRDVTGIRIPFTAVVRRDNAVLLERTLTDVQINVTIPPTFFQKVQ